MHALRLAFIGARYWPCRGLLSQCRRWAVEPPDSCLTLLCLYVSMHTHNCYLVLRSDGKRLETFLNVKTDLRKFSAAKGTRL